MPNDGASIGIALSGGGFRAAAFHIGVLKRLDERGLLQNARCLSAVSGGAILAAYWRYWVTCKCNPEDLTDRKKVWDEFSRAFMRLLRADLRRWLLIRAFVAPLTYMSVIPALVLTLCNSFGSWLLLPVAGLGIIYLGSYARWWFGAHRRSLVQPATTNAKDFCYAGLAASAFFLPQLLSHWLGPLWDTPLGRFGVADADWVPALTIGMTLGLIPLAHSMMVSHLSKENAIVILRKGSGLWLTDWLTVVLLAGGPYYIIRTVLFWPSRLTIWSEWALLALFVCLIALIVAHAYLLLHYQGPNLLVSYYDRHVFCGKTMSELSSRHDGQTLVISATSLNNGQPLHFSSDPSILLQRKTAGTWMPAETRIAKAVVASSAFPGLIAPLRLLDPLGIFPVWAIDGGFFDNQGVQALLDTGCSRIIVSDGAASLSERPFPSTWLVGVLRRASDTQFERIRYLNHSLLTVQFGERVLYVELRPILRDLSLSPESNVPQEIASHIATVRTDLDRFSDIEVFTLFSHGYSLINDCLQHAGADWPIYDAPIDCTLAGVPTTDWKALDEKQRQWYAYYLMMSKHRNRYWRWFRRYFG